MNLCHVSVCNDRLQTKLKNFTLIKFKSGEPKLPFGSTKFVFKFTNISQIENEDTLMAIKLLRSTKLRPIERSINFKVGYFGYSKTHSYQQSRKWLRIENNEVSSN